MIATVVVLVVLWYLTRALAPHWPPAHAVTEAVAPRTRTLHAWVLSAPATFAYIAVFTASTIVQRTAPPRLIDLLTQVQSTNLARLRASPLTVLTDSALWVADRGVGLLGYVVVFATVVAFAERRYGTPRLIVICVTGHVLGTLLTAIVELHAIQSGRAPFRLAVTTDVGVSYIMVAGCAAAVLVMAGWWRVAGGLTLAAAVLLPVLLNHTIWDLGHVFATLAGLLAAGFALLAAPQRRPVDFTACLPTTPRHRS